LLSDAATLTLKIAETGLTLSETALRTAQGPNDIGPVRIYSIPASIPALGRGVPGFGDPKARLLLIGLAPAAHGANRTGRVFTGDGVGGSGDFLMSALHRAGFANIPTSHHPGDGLTLKDAFIAAAVRCAPPDNKPTPEEIRRCLPHLDAEITALPRIHVVVALGRIAFDAYFRLLQQRGVTVRPRPAFGHALAHDLPNGQTLIGCYHPSRQNTNTGRLTRAMWYAPFRRAKAILA